MFHRPLALLGSAALSLLARVPMPARPAVKEFPSSSARRRSTPVKRRGAESILAAQSYLHRRHLHPGASSSVRKLQRAFRIAGRDFASGKVASRAAGRG